jgi:hypothetical protein
MPTWMHGKIHAECFLQRSVPNVPVVQCSSQMSVLSTGVCILETLSFGLRRTPMFMKSWRETHLTLWCVLDWVQHTFGPFFFHGSVTGRAYHGMLSEWLVPQLQQAGIETLLSCNWMVHHHTLFVLHVRDYLNKAFPGRWIGRGSEASPAPFAWPPRSPDLTTPDNALWGFIKERLGKMRCRTTSVTGSCLRSLHWCDPGLSARTWCRIQLCYDNEGLHTNVLNS